MASFKIFICSGRAKPLGLHLKTHKHTHRLLAYPSVCPGVPPKSKATIPSQALAGRGTADYVNPQQRQIRQNPLEIHVQKLRALRVP